MRLVPGLCTIKQRSLFMSLRSVKPIVFRGLISVRYMPVAALRSVSYGHIGSDIPALIAFSVSRKDYSSSVHRNKVRRRMRSIVSSLLLKNVIEQRSAFLISIHKDAIAMNFINLSELTERAVQLCMNRDTSTTR